MQEEKLVELLDGLMSTACDNCKKKREYPRRKRKRSVRDALQEITFVRS